MAKVLIAEADTKSRELLHKLLENWGHDVVPTCDGAEALGKTDSESFDLIVSDWMMPNLTGLELCETLKKRKSNIPFIMIGAKRTEEDINQAYRSGITHFVAKPFKQDALQARITNALL